MKYIIDRIEGDIAVCETQDNKYENISLEILYVNAKEGDCFECVNGRYIFSEEETVSARKKNISLQNRLFE